MDLALASDDPSVSLESHHLMVSGNSTLNSATGGGLTMGNLMLESGSSLTVNGAFDAAFNDVAVIGDGMATLNISASEGAVGNLVINGALLSGGEAATVAIDAETMVLVGGSSYMATVGETAHDLLNVSGSVDIEDGTTLVLQPNGADPFYQGQTATVIEAGGEGLGGSFEDEEGGVYIANVFKEGDALKIEIAHDLLPGDANLDGKTNVLDFNEWNANKFTSPTTWQLGDFDGDGKTNVLDFNEWNANKFTSVTAPAPAAEGQVPEPGTLALLAAGLIGLLAWRRRRAA
jgi:hypothetical protein